MNFKLTEHCLDELNRRNISMEYIFEIMEDPQQLIQLSAERSIYQSIVVEDCKEELVRLIVDTNTIPFSVVTVYKTGNIKKYRRE